jgi:hypothetical protein
VNISRVRSGDHVEHDLPAILGMQEEHILLAREVREEGPGRHAGRRGDLGDGGLLVAPLAEQPHRGLQQRTPSADLLAFAMTFHDATLSHTLLLYIDCNFAACALF